MAHGVAWGVTLDLPPNVPLILTRVPADPYCFAGLSSQPPLPSGQEVYIYVDSVDYATVWGAVRESNQNNNTVGPVVSAMGGGSGSPAHTGSLPPIANLPWR